MALNSTIRTLRSRDVTDALPFNVGQPGYISDVWTNTTVAYDVAIGGLPFFYGINDQRPYERQTAPYKKQQFDNSAEPGEQTLEGWWLRSQSSFHGGAGITFYDPSAGETVLYRFTNSKGVNVWNKGEVSLLRKSTVIGVSPDNLDANGRSQQNFETIEWTESGVVKNGILYVDNYIMAKVDEDGTVINFQTIDPAVDEKIYAATTDGTTAYWVTNAVSGGSKLTMYKKSLNADYTTSATQMLQENGIVVNNAVMEFTKERIIAAINDKVYEIPTSASSLPTAIYTHPSSGHIWTSVTSGGTAIYVSGWNGATSSIVKFTVADNGTVTSLSAAQTAAELPIGEKVYAIKQYLGYMLIGTNKGLRVAIISPDDGSLAYGPLVFESHQPVYDFAFRDRFVWCASGTTDGSSGLIRVDLGNQIETLRFAYANDLSTDETVTNFPTTALGFLGETDRLLWVNAASLENTITFKQLTSNVATLTTGTAHGYAVGDIIFVSGVGAPFDGTPTIAGFKTITAVPSTTTFSYAAVGADVALTAVSPAGAVIKGGNGYIESATEYVESGFIQTGYIRYGTLEPKNFKRIRARGDYDNGGLLIAPVGEDGTIYETAIYNSTLGTPEINIINPPGSQEYVAFRFTLSRYEDPTDTDSTLDTTGPIFKGYQVRSLPATPRQRLVQLPLYCYDLETDRYNVQVGFDGRAWERIQAIEQLESTGDELIFQDFTTGEQATAIVESVSFQRATPPSGGFSGFGGYLTVLIREV